MCKGFLSLEKLDFPTFFKHQTQTFHPLNEKKVDPKNDVLLLLLY